MLRNDFMFTPDWELNLFALTGSLGCWSHLDPITSRLKGVGVGTYAPNGQYALKDVVYQDAGIYKCVGQSPTNKKKLEVLNTIALGVKGKVDLISIIMTANWHPFSWRIRFPHRDSEKCNATSISRSATPPFCRVLCQPTRARCKMVTRGPSVHAG